MKKLYLRSPYIFILYIFFTFSLISHASAVSDSISLDLTKTHSPELVNSFYESRDYRPAWTRQGKYSVRAYRFINILNHAQYYGLNPNNYHIHELLALKDADASEQNTGRMEALLTDGFFAFAHHLEKGQLDKRTLKLKQKSEGHNADILFLENSLRSPTLKSDLESLQPSHPYYHKLKAELQEKLDAFNNNALWAGKKTEELRQDILKLALNMERWRWEDSTYTDRHIFVNLPSYKLEVWENGEVTMESKVLVGTARQRTHNQDSQIDRYIIHPTLVPKEMLAEELIPLIVKDPAYLTTNEYELLDGDNPVDASTLDWEAYSVDNFPYIVRQPDPNHRSMNFLKFNLDSTGIIHDSESSSLFFRNVRAFSGGCIIMEKAKDLALYLAKDNEEITLSDMEAYFAGNAYKEITVKHPMHVYVRYFTADGSEMYQDIYDQDQPLLAYFNDMVKGKKSNMNLQRSR